MVVHAPTRSLEQRRDALKRANEIRTYRAQLKRDVQSGDAPYDAFLRRPVDPRLRTMRLEEALRNMPAIGEVMSRYILRNAQISPSKTLGGLFPAAWERLFRALEVYPSVRRRLSEARATVSEP